jgi:four helix bundle protein
MFDKPFLLDVPLSFAGEGVGVRGRAMSIICVKPGSIAKGSLSELETQMLIAAELGYLPPEHQIFPSLDRVGRLLSGLHKHVALPK